MKTEKEIKERIQLLETENNCLANEIFEKRNKRNFNIRTMEILTSILGDEGKEPEPFYYLNNIPPIPEHILMKISGKDICKMLQEGTDFNTLINE